MILRKDKHGFTLLELMAAVGIISILLGFLLPALQAVTRHSRKVTARHEVQMLAAAFAQYYSTYSRWPSMDEDDRLSPRLAAMLQGLEPEAGMSGEDENPHRFCFVDFSRVDAQGYPVNPWFRVGGGYTPHYYVRVDADFDNRIDITDLNAGVETVIRPVVVWTINPHVNRSGENRVIGSWQE